MKKVLVLGALVMMAMTSLVAQDRYGHLNLGNLISLMPESVSANDSLELFQTELVAAGEKAVVEFQRDAEQFMKQVNEGVLTPVVQQQQQAALEQRQAELANFEQSIGVAMEQKRNMLLGPIIEKAEAALTEVAKENGFKLVFDTSVYGAVMYAQDSEDLMPLVKAKLGITE